MQKNLFRFLPNDPKDVISSEPRYSSAVNALCEFLETAIYCILSSREVYPKELFEKRRKYGQIIYRSRYAPLSSYILEFIYNAKQWIENGQSQRLELSITDYTSMEPQERFIFQFQILSSVFPVDDKILDSKFSNFILPITFGEVNYPSKCCKWFLQAMTSDPSAPQDLWTPDQGIKKSNMDIELLEQMQTEWITLDLHLETKRT